MKKKIFLSLTIVILAFTISGILDTSYSAVRRNAALETVNGGEAEFVVSEQLNSKRSNVGFLVNVGLFFVTVSTIGWIFKKPKKISSQ